MEKVGGGHTSARTAADYTRGSGTGNSEQKFNTSENLNLAPRPADDDAAGRKLDQQPLGRC